MSPHRLTSPEAVEAFRLWPGRSDHADQTKMSPDPYPGGEVCEREVGGVGIDVDSRSRGGSDLARANRWRERVARPEKTQHSIGVD